VNSNRAMASSDGVIYATADMIVPPPWELRESSKYAGEHSSLIISQPLACGPHNRWPSMCISRALVLLQPRLDEKRVVPAPECVRRPGHEAAPAAVGIARRRRSSAGVAGAGRFGRRGGQPQGIPGGQQERPCPPLSGVQRGRRSPVPQRNDRAGVCPQVGCRGVFDV